jgi:hypothetical protein
MRVSMTFLRGKKNPQKYFEEEHIMSVPVKPKQTRQRIELL